MPSDRHISFLLLIVVFIAGAGVFHQTRIEIKKLIADHYFWKLQEEWYSENYYTGYLLHWYIKDLNINDIYYDRYFSRLLTDSFNKFYEQTKIVKGREILNNILVNLEKQPKTYNNIFALAKIHSSLTSEESIDHLNLAINYFNEYCIRRLKCL